MSSLRQSAKYREIDEELSKSEFNIFQVGNKDLSELFLNSFRFTFRYKSNN